MIVSVDYAGASSNASPAAHMHLTQTDDKKWNGKQRAT